MIQLFKMALRDLGRNRRRTFFSALALGIGLSILLLMAAFISGEFGGSIDKAIALQSGHLQVRAPKYNEDRTSLAYEDLIENPDALAAQIAALEPVKLVTPRLFASGIVAVNEKSVGVRIVGIDTASQANAPFQSGIVSGSFINADDREGILIGQTLAEKLGLKTNDRITLLVNTSNGDVQQQPFLIRGVYTTHTPGFDENNVLMPLPKAQAITSAGNHASTLFILLKDKTQSGAVLTALASSPYQIKTWQQLNELALSTEELANGFIYVLYLIVLGITATVIVNTLIMAVFERTREIGILSAIGMRSSGISLMFLIEAAFLTLGGIILGLLIGGAMVAYFTKFGFFIGNYGVSGILIGETIYTQLTLSDTITLTVMAMVVSLLASLYPAMLAARMEPVEALHGGRA
jgi:ABC-type lipoprotein release transport system permease subunit